MIRARFYCLLTEFAFRTVKYKDKGLEVRTELARSVRKDRGRLNILQYEKETRSILGMFIIATANFTENLPEALGV